MTKKKRSQQEAAASNKGKKKQSGLMSWAIPAIAGVVVLAIIVGAIISIERQPSAADISVPVVTTQPGSTREIPFPGVSRISVDETQQLLEQGEVVVVDVRTAASYDQSHIAGAISIPEQEMATRMDELPHDKDVILYCT